jgi:DNA-binding NarL/FixJ family response regulator
MIRMGLSGALAREPDIEVVGEACTGEEALAMFEELKPDVTLMDGMLPDIHGVEVTARIIARHPDARILVVSINDTAEDVHRAIEAGACGYLLKSSGRRQMIEAIRAATDGKTYLSPELKRKLEERSLYTTLSSREIEVLRLIAHGKANKEIAGDLKLSELTVKAHISHILTKLGASDRTHAVTLALERGMLRL